MGWEAAVARGRGLATHLVSRDTLLRAAEAGSWTGAARTLVTAGFPAIERDLASRADFDRAAGRIAAARMELLGRWLGNRRGALAVIYEDENRRSIRRLLRGAAEGTSRETRLRGLTPTPELPERVLVRLASAASPERLIDMLVHAGHPAGRVLATARGPRRAPQAPGLWRSELELDRLFATRVTRAARRAGAPVRRFTALLIDVENAWSVLSASHWGDDVTPEEVFLEGGKALDRDAFLTLARLPESGDGRWRGLARQFASTPLGRLFADPRAAALLEDQVAVALVAWQRAEARKNPLSAAAVLDVLLRIQARRTT